MRTLAFCFILILHFSAQGQTSTPDSICWTKNNKLKWSDFQGPPPEGNLWWKAACAASISAKGSMDDKGIPVFIIQPCFSKHESWTRDTVSVKLLAHEQVHFDVAELYARKIRKAIEDLQKKKVKDFNVYRPVLQRLLEERETTNIKYDTETKHGTIPDLQEKWAKKIAAEMSSLEKYSSK